jgi:hypothetical protein
VDTHCGIMWEWMHSESPFPAILAFKKLLPTVRVPVLCRGTSMPNSYTPGHNAHIGAFSVGITHLKALVEDSSVRYLFLKEPIVVFMLCSP